MPDSVKFSELQPVSAVGAADIFAIGEEDQQAETGYKSKKATATDVGKAVNNSIEYDTALDNFATPRTPISCLNQLLEQVWNLYPAKTIESTPIATLTDGAADVPMKSLVVGIEPKQASGTPTPDNLLPITGFTGANIMHTGKNLCSDVINECTINSSAVLSTNSNNNMFLAEVKAGATYTVSETGFVGGFFENKPVLGDTTYDGTRVVQNDNPTFTAPIDGWVAFRTASTTTQAQLDAGTTATDYEPHTATIYPISWQTEAGTVYGAWYDVTTGKLTVTHLAIPFNSQDLTWIYQEANTRFYTTSLNSVIKKTSSAVLMPEGFNCECYHPNPFATIDNLDIAVATSGNIFVKDANYTDVTAWLNAIGNQKIVYPLETPIEYTLTPTQIKTQGDTESIFADCGKISGEYRCNIQAYIDELAATSGTRTAGVQTLMKNATIEEKTEDKKEEPETSGAEEPKEEK